MPALLPIMLTGRMSCWRPTGCRNSIRPGCRAAVAAGAMPNGNADGCKRDELAARDKLNEQWGQFTPAQQARCVSLSKLGGFPSYVELLTCLEMAKAAESPAAGRPASPARAPN